MDGNPGDAACEPEGGAVKGVFRLFGEGDELYAEMIRSVRTASQRIFLASYILAADEVGAELLDGLKWRPYAAAPAPAQGRRRPSTALSPLELAATDALQPSRPSQAAGH